MSEDRDLKFVPLANFDSAPEAQMARELLANNGNDVLLQGANFGARFQTQLFADGFAADQHGGGSVHDAAGIARVVNVVDAFDFGVTLNGDGVESGLFARRCERRIELGQIRHRCFRSHVFVVIQNRQPDLIFDRHDGVVEVTIVPGVFRPALAFDGVSIHVFA